VKANFAKIFIKELYAMREKAAI